MANDYWGLKLFRHPVNFTNCSVVFGKTLCGQLLSLVICVCCLCHELLTVSSLLCKAVLLLATLCFYANMTTLHSGLCYRKSICRL